MSKVNVDEIKVGDLVAYNRRDDSIRIGYVTGLSETKVKAYWSIPNMVHHSHMPIDSITGHWKVINFEEEAKVDELKVYTGKETLQALLEGKILESKPQKYQYKFTDKLMTLQDDNTWMTSIMGFNNVMALEFTEVATPQVGDWVKVDSLGKYTHIAQVTRLEGNKMWADWESKGSESFFRVDSKGITWQILSPEEVSEYKREQAFAKVGRELNEFKEGDLVLIETETVSIVCVVTSKNNTTEVAVHKLNEAKVYKAKPHQLTPICFVENQVDLS
mgnify:CR=1 FL=1